MVQERRQKVDFFHGSFRSNLLSDFGFCRNPLSRTLVLKSRGSSVTRVSAPYPEAQFMPRILLPDSNRAPCCSNDYNLPGESKTCSVDIG